MYYDITLTINERMPVYPGDDGYSRHRLKDMSNGDELNLSVIKMGAHTGTHIDAPFHFLNDGISVDKLDLDSLIGPVKVIKVQAIKEIMLKDIIHPLSNFPKRVIFKTVNSKLWNKPFFEKEFVHLSQEVTEYLISEEVRLVGIDYLSIEKFHSPDHIVHKKLLDNNIIILEGLDLRKVKPGDYELICLPLKFEGSDGSPARVILRDLQ